jgi:hypothetical protein
MASLIISFVVLAGLPVALLVGLKTNAGIMFLAACAGLILLESLDPTVVTTAGAIVPGEGEAFVRLAVVLLSVVFSGVMFRHSVSNSQIPIHILIAFLIGVMLALILPASTGVSWLLDTTRESLWQDVNDYRTLVIAGGFSLSLLAILLAKPAKHGKEKH